MSRFSTDSLPEMRRGSRRSLAEQGHQIARKIVREQREVVDHLVDLLIEKETIDGEEFRVIVAEYAEVPEKERFIPQLQD